MIKIIIKRNTFASSLRNRFIVISSVPITLSRRRNRRSNKIWIQTTIGMTTFWAKAIRFISFSISYKAVYISNLPDKPILVRVYRIRYEKLPWNSKLELLSYWFHKPNRQYSCLHLEPLSIPHWRKLEYHWLMSIRTYRSSLDHCNLKCPKIILYKHLGVYEVTYNLCNITVTHFTSKIIRGDSYN